MSVLFAALVSKGKKIQSCVEYCIQTKSQPHPGPWFCLRRSNGGAESLAGGHREDGRSRGFPLGGLREGGNTPASFTCVSYFHLKGTIGPLAEIYTKV